MSVKYICRHCRTMIGEINSNQVSEAQLGFHFLTPDERSDIISYNLNGDMIVTVTCHYCGEALENNPELTLIGNPLQ